MAMNDAYEPPKIVPLTPRPDGGGERVGELLNAVRGIAGKRLQQCLGHLFEHVDDALFDLAEKAENNATQTHYFDGMREVRKRRPAIERNFLATVNLEMGGLTSRAAPSPAPAQAMAELSLVADTDLEESLAITSMGSKHESRLARDLFAINQRLSVICGGRKIEDANNPIAPAALSQAFRLALRELTADMRVKLLIYKLFDRYVLSTLEELYTEANELLARAGVLPQLRVSAPRGSSAAPRGAVAPPSAVVAGAVAADMTDPAAAELLQTLHSLFAARRGGTVASARAGDAGSPTPSASELLGALSVLQTQLAAGQIQREPSMVDGTGNFDREAVSQLKEQLLGQLGALRGTRPSHVAGIDEDTIDLVGMLFEFILEDHTLPPEMQALLARLQIPYLKAAILDRKLFAHRQHPARRLLDALADQAKGWSADSDRDGRLHEKIKGVVDQLLHEFDDDLGIFERLLADLQQFNESSRRRSELAEQRVAESTRGREKLEQARRRAAREIVDRIGGRQLPPLVHEVLARAWANHLVLVQLRQGEESSEFRDGLRFVDDFIASTRPATDAAARQYLRQLLPGIERALREGLANVAFQQPDIERLLGQLRDWYAQHLGEPRHAAPSTPATANAPAVTAEAAAVAAIPESIQPIIDQNAEPESELPEESVRVDTNSPEWRQVEALQPGVWLEFQLPEEPMTRAKLSWVSPMSGRYLFVNRRGLKVADYSPQELAVLLASGHAQVLATNALFDRAMSAIVSRLRQPEPPNASTDAE